MLGRFRHFVYRSSIKFLQPQYRSAFRQEDVRVCWRLLPYPFLTLLGVLKVKCEDRDSWCDQGQGQNYCTVPPTLTFTCPDSIPVPCPPPPCATPSPCPTLPPCEECVYNDGEAVTSAVKVVPRVEEEPPKLKMSTSVSVKTNIKLPQKEKETFASMFGVQAAAENTTSFEPEELTHKFLLKQACVVNVDSVTRIITETISALEDYHAMYREMLRQLMDSLEDSRGASERQQELITCRMIVLRSQLDDMKTNIAEIESYLNSVERLAYATAETAFLAHAEYASIALSERMQSALAEASRISSTTKEMERDLVQLQTIVIVESGNSLK